MLCYEGFAVLHSGITCTPLWSAEHLTRAGVDAAHRLPREGIFHSESALPRDEAADLADYRRSGYDRGHMSSNGDMSTVEAQQQSFSLANMIPQAPKLNRVLWEGIESAVRNWAVRAGEVYVVTGPVFQGASLQMIGGRVIVPTSVFKEVIAGIRRRHGVAPVKKHAADADVLRDILQAIPGDDLRSMRDRALLAFGMAGAFRRSELVGLRFSDVEWVKEGLGHHPAGKDRPGGRGRHHRHSGGTPAAAQSPARGLAAARGVVDGFLFRRLIRGKGGTATASAFPMSDRAIARLVQARVRAAGYDPTGFAGHSLRSGFLTAAARSGASIFKMREVSRHKSM